jgi:hypothetical protein
MKYKDAQYIQNLDTKKVDQIKVKINDVESFVPMSEGNRDYAEIRKLVKEKTLTIEEAE